MAGSSTSQYQKEGCGPTGAKFVRPNGMTELYRPTGDIPAVADVIFIHGLGGHPRNTWAVKTQGKDTKLKFWRGSNEAQSKSSHGVFWPQDLLPVDQRDIRILTYGYDSEITHGFFEASNKNGIYEHGISLLNAIVRAQRECSDRPLIFVAHSLGGLLIKQALVEAKKYEDSSDDKRLHNIYTNTYAIVFLGTPHRGSDLADWGRLASNIAKAALLDINQKILTELGPSQTSKLAELSRDFFNILEHKSRTQRIKTFTFIEAKGVSGIRGASSKVVQDWSATLSDSLQDRHDTINANHMSMCRFRGQDDEGYEKVESELARYIKELNSEKNKSIIEKRKEEQDNIRDQATRIIKFFDFEELYSRQAQISNTQVNYDDVSWVFSEETGFKAWLEEANTVFWIQGKPGSGKSTLLNFLVNHLKRNKNSSKELGVVVYFFFDFRQGESTGNNLEGLLRTLLTQLMKEDPQFVPINAKDLDARRDLGEGSLRKYLFDGLRQLKKKVYAFIDGLDEFDEKKMFNLVHLLKEIEKLDNVKICIASRPHPLLVELFYNYPGFKIQDHNYKGISSYVTTRLRILSNSDSQPILLRIAQSITRRAEGVFIWACFALNELMLDYIKGATEEEVLQKLDELPGEVSDLYTRIWDRLKPSQQREAIVSFLIIMGSRNKMYLDDHIMALDIALDHFSEPQKSLEGFRVKQAVKRLMTNTGGMVECEPLFDWTQEGYDIRGSQGITKYSLKLIHRTVEAYLESTILPQWQKLTSHNLHSVFSYGKYPIVDICLCYLKSFCSKAVLKQYIISGASYNWDLKYNHHTVDFGCYDWPLLKFAIDEVFSYAGELETEGQSSSPLFEGLDGSILPILHLQSCRHSGYHRPCRCRDLLWLSHLTSLSQSTGGHNLSLSPGIYIAAAHHLPLHLKHLVEAVDQVTKEEANFVLNIAVTYRRRARFPRLNFWDLLLSPKRQLAVGDLVDPFQRFEPTTFETFLFHPSVRSHLRKEEYGEEVSPLWIFATYCQILPQGCSGLFITSRYSFVVEAILESGQDIDYIVGPRGTALQTILHNIVKLRYQIAADQIMVPVIRYDELGELHGVDEIPTFFRCSHHAVKIAALLRHGANGTINGSSIESMRIISKIVNTDVNILDDRLAILYPHFLAIIQAFLQYNVKLPWQNEHGAELSMEELKRVIENKWKSAVPTLIKRWARDWVHDFHVDSDYDDWFEIDCNSGTDLELYIYH